MQHMHGEYIVPLGMKGCICHFAKWQIHPFISKGTIYGEALMAKGRIISMIRCTKELKIYRDSLDVHSMLHAPDFRLLVEAIK